MKGRDFLKSFLNTIAKKADLPAGRDEFEKAIGLTHDLEAEVTPQRLKNSIMLVIQHIRSNHSGRIYPKRLDELERKLRKTDRVSVAKYVDSLLLACSCDYLLELPKPKEWQTDGALRNALTCGISIGLGSVVPDRQGRYGSLEDTFMQAALEKLLEALGIDEEPHQHDDRISPTVH